MRHRGRLLDTMRRAETGPMIEDTKFDREIVAPAVAKIAKSHDIKLEDGAIIAHDPALLSRLFEAGLTLAEEVGVYCQNTSRRILWTRAELEDGLRSCLDTVTIGEGLDAITTRTRRPQDGQRPLVSGGPYGVVFPEDQYVPVMLSYARESVLDAIDPPTLENVYGMPVKAASPWEALGGWREAELSFQAIRSAGRPGLSLGCVGLCTTEIAELSATSWGGFRPSDRHYLAMLGEFKTNYHMLTKAVHLNRTGCLIQSFYNPVVGGYVGGMPGVAVALTAGSILLNQLYSASTFGGSPIHPFIPSDAMPDLLWAISAAMQAVASNTNLMLHSLVRPAAGPGTRMMLLENAAYSIAVGLSGATMISSSMSAGGVHTGHASGLDSRICGEVAHTLGDLSIEEGEAIIQQLVAEYTPMFDDIPIGQPFDKVYDLERIVPTAAWQGTYDEVREDLSRMGLKF
jgi:methylamine---corrinoid protein Co-methyltransferase